MLRITLTYTLLKPRFLLFTSFLHFPIFYFIQMATQPPSPKKNAGGRISTKTPGLTYSKTPYYIPNNLAELLQYLGMVLRKRADSTTTAQVILEEGLARQIMVVYKQKNIIIPEDILPTDNDKLRTNLLALNATISAAISANANSNS